MNIWKSYTWTAEWRIIWRKIIAVIYTTYAVGKRKPEKKFRLVRNSNPWPLRYRCSALPIKLTVHYGKSFCSGKFSLGSRSFKYINGRDPFNQNSNRSDREKWSTSKGGPVFSKLFRLDRTDPLSFGPKFSEILVEWIAPTKWRPYLWKGVQESFQVKWLLKFLSMSWNISFLKSHSKNLEASSFNKIKWIGFYRLIIKAAFLHGPECWLFQ